MSDSGTEQGHAGSFADGGRTLPHSAADHVPGHFSEGSEADHDALAQQVGQFSDGVERAHAEHIRMGSFADTDCPKCREMADSAGAAS